MSLGRHFPVTQDRPQGGKSACHFQDEASRKPHRALHGWALARPFRLPPFRLLSHPQEGDASGGSRGRGALASLWWRHSLSAWKFTPRLWSGPLTDSQQHSLPVALKRTCSQDPVLSSAGFFPHKSLLSAYCVHSIYWHRGKVGKSCEADAPGSLPAVTSSLCGLGQVAFHFGTSILPL